MLVGIIGAGACGLSAATVLEQNKIDYLILERNKKPGSKILASGNGKCNIMHDDNIVDNARLKAFLAMNSCPIYKDNEGRCYPISNSSQTIVDVFLANINLNKLKLNTLVSNITKVNNKYIIGPYQFDKLVLASGSFANIIKEKATLCYDYLASLNLKLTKLKPSLVGFKVKEDLSLLKNKRFKAEVSLYNDYKLVKKENGEVIFKENGLSGIVIMNMSYYYNHLARLNKPYLVLNLNPEFDYSKLKDLKYALPGNSYLFFKDRSPNNLTLEIIDTYDFTEAQVISGGVSLDEVKPNYSLKKDPNIYIGGELLDKDFPCGGYNLSHAFMTGFKIGEGIVNEIRRFI